jgi:surfactin synthase thioesterase subunit
MLNVINPQADLRRRGSIRRIGVRPRPLMRLVCFPWCGAGASVFRRLAASLPDHIEPLAVQLPGREDRFGEKLLRRMDEVVAHVLDDTVALLDRPLVLFGHSMGAIVAYEVARTLKQRTGREPDVLIVSGHGSPCAKPRTAKSWHTADEDAFIANILQLGGTPSVVLNDRDMMRMFIPVLKADYEVLETHVHRPPLPLLSCPLVACAGKQDAEVTPDTLHAWSRLTTGPSHVHWFEGDHFYLCAQPETLTRHIEQWSALVPAAV